MDDERGTIIPGETASVVTVFRVHGGHGVRVAGILPTDSS